MSATSGWSKRERKHTDAFNDGSPELDIEVAPVLRVPKLDGIEPFPQLVAGALARYKLRVNLKLGELVLKLLGPCGARVIAGRFAIGTTQSVHLRLE